MRDEMAAKTLAVPYETITLSPSVCTPVVLLHCNTTRANYIPRGKSHERCGFPYRMQDQFLPDPIYEAIQTRCLSPLYNYHYMAHFKKVSSI